MKNFKEEDIAKIALELQEKIKEFKNTEITLEVKGYVAYLTVNELTDGRQKGVQLKQVIHLFPQDKKYVRVKPIEFH